GRGDAMVAGTMELFCACFCADCRVSVFLRVSYDCYGSATGHHNAHSTGDHNAHSTGEHDRCGCTCRGPTAATSAGQEPRDYKATDRSYSRFRQGRDFNLVRQPIGLQPNLAARKEDSWAWFSKRSR